MLTWVRRLLQRSMGDVESPFPPIPPIPPAPEATDVDGAFATGMAHFHAGRHEQAIAGLEAVLDARHDHAEAHHFLGMACARLGRLRDAADAFHMALHFAPRMGAAHFALALAQRKMGDAAAALAGVEQAIECGVPGADVHNLHGALRMDHGDVAGAVSSFERAIAADPDHPLGHNNLGFVLFRDLGEYARGAAHIERARALAPDDLAVQCNTVIVMSHRGELEAAIELCDRLLARSPDLHEARLNRALALLKLGRFASAWEDYEARKLVRSNYVPRGFPFPEWRGEDLAGRTVLVHGEQGLGDEIMFASCYAELSARAGHCIIECDPRLQALFKRSFAQATVVSGAGSGTGAPPAIAERPVDYCIAAGSLPGRWRRAWSDFPRHSGYLSADPDAVAAWRARLDAIGPGLKVGLSWRGGMRSTRQSLRSMKLVDLEPLLAMPGCQFVDLQYGDTDDELRALENLTGRRLHRWREAIDDFDQAAAVIANLDLVISVCTAVVHLSGAIGRPVWVMTPLNAEWRYLRDGDAMPWYPSARLFRQARENDWAPVVSAMADALAGRVRPLSSRPPAPGA